jgi:hypothetical protein
MGLLIERTPDRRPEPPSTPLKLRAAALFTSALQASEHPSDEQVHWAVATTLQRLGTAGCAARLAGEFGDHPELAAARMAWALATIRGAYQTPDSVPMPAPRALALAS